MYYSPIQRLKAPFPGLEQVSRNYSQAFQDMFVLSALGGKRGGFFLEVGASDPVFISNTYLLESKFGWRGVSVEINPRSARRFARKRKSTIIEADALKLDYEQILADSGAPERIDYLQVDIDPSSQSLRCLKLLPLDRYRFSVITFETDFYDPEIPIEDKLAIREESRQLLRKHGYLLLGAGIANTGPDDVFEDWWVDPGVVDDQVISKLQFPGEFGDSGQRFLTEGPHVVATELYAGQGLGNQLWAYAVTRSIAQQRGLDFAILGRERFKGSAIFDIDFGESLPEFKRSREGKSPNGLPAGLRFYKRERRVTSHESGVDVSGPDDQLFRVPANTLLDGTFQAYKYLENVQGLVHDWIRIPSGLEPLDSNTCVIHVRAGDFRNVPHASLGRSYYENAIESMVKMQGVDRFICVSDQPQVATELLPDSVQVISDDRVADPLKARHHFGGRVEDDFGMLLRARNMIISNSSFAWWAAFLNSNEAFVIAPKFWSNHMGTSDEWSTSGILTPGFTYLDRDSNLLTFEECQEEMALHADPENRVVESGDCQDFLKQRGIDRIREWMRVPYHMLARK